MIKLTDSLSSENLSAHVSADRVIENESPASEKKSPVLINHPNTRELTTELNPGRSLAIHEIPLVIETRHEKNQNQRDAQLITHYGLFFSEGSKNSNR